MSAAPQAYIHDPAATPYTLEARDTSEHELRSTGEEGCCEAAQATTSAANSLPDTLTMNGKRKAWLFKHHSYDHQAAELRKQFPVSSGTDHRAFEGRVVQPAHMKLKIDEQWNSYAPPVRVGPPSTPQFGLKMLKKMGWSPGEGLGKNKEGTVEPVVPDGLYYSQQHDPYPKKQPVSLVEDLSGKHPVMALTELCTKFSWNPPKFEVETSAGPDHKKNFLMKVIVNGQEFKPAEPASSKKQAKADAAALFLESIGLFKRTKTPQC